MLCVPFFQTFKAETNRAQFARTKGCGLSPQDMRQAASQTLCLPRTSPGVSAVGVEKKENGTSVAVPVEEMKTKSSHRTLPLIPVIVDALKEQKEKQEAWRKLFKRSYSRQFNDYVCTNQLGELFHPEYVTRHFRLLLDQYGLRHIRFHDLRHPYVKPPQKNF